MTFLVVDSEIEDNLRTLQESPPLMNDEEKAKLEVIKLDSLWK